MASNTTGSIARPNESNEKLKEIDQLFEDGGEHGSNTCISLDKSLSEAMADFDRHFCRKCLIFCCTLHGTSQPLIFPEFGDEGDKKQPCSDHCYLMLNGVAKEGQIDEIPVISNWKTLEKDLCLKGIEIFGRNSCLISLNLLSGWKTCMEVATYMHAKVDSEIPSRSPPSMWKSVTDENKTPYHHTHCGCKGICGEQCPCILNKSSCEKYCGCSRLCRNQFKGCYCSKGQCRSQQCPCFAAARECHPDICRNCWVSCGDGSLGEPEPPHHGNGQCGNMRIFLGQKQRILLSKSDIGGGWGAFIKYPVNKDDYLGEYKGELVSHSEAKERQVLYGRDGPSFLLSLNDKYVIDAYHNRTKLKFINHSSEPNCYAKIMLVNGDHRVGIFAKERIEAAEELFCDLHRPPWFINPLADGSKENESTSSQRQGQENTTRTDGP